MQIQPRPIPSPAPPATPAAPGSAAAQPSAPSLPPHAWENRTFAEMPDRASPEWGKPKPQLTVQTGMGELAKIPKHPAQMTEGEMMSRYFDPAYKFDTAAGKSAEPFFAQPGHYLESPTREAPVPRTLPKDPAPVQASPGLWSGTPLPRKEPAAQPVAPAKSEASEPLLSHERPPERSSPPPADRFAGFAGWGQGRPGAAHRGGNDYYGSDWD